MTSLRPLLLSLSRLAAVLMVLALPCEAGDPVDRDTPMLVPTVEMEADSTPVVPEPRALVFVGLGGLVVLAFALRRK